MGEPKNEGQGAYAEEDLERDVGLYESGTYQVEKGYFLSQGKSMEDLFFQNLPNYIQNNEVIIDNMQLALSASGFEDQQEKIERRLKMLQMIADMKKDGVEDVRSVYIGLRNAGFIRDEIVS